MRRLAPCSSFSSPRWPLRNTRRPPTRTTRRSSTASRRTSRRKAWSSSRAGRTGIPTSGMQQAQQLKKNQPGYGRNVPNVIYRDPNRKGLTVITGPDGTTVCRDASGRVTVCY